VPRITSSATSVVPSDSNETATTILTNTLKFYGLNEPELVNEIRAALANRTITGASSVDEIGIQLRESPAFQRRFAANEARRAAGKPVYSVTQTLLLESQYRKNLRDSGMPAGFYDDPTSLQNFLINDISPDEILSRVTQGYQAVRNADPTVINELKTLYNLDDGSIAAFFVDPAKAQDNILRAARAAEIGAQARKQAGIGLTRETAEELVRQGISEARSTNRIHHIQTTRKPLPTIDGRRRNHPRRSHRRHTRHKRRSSPTSRHTQTTTQRHIRSRRQSQPTNNRITK
jgi:hypothetical protein